MFSTISALAAVNLAPSAALPYSATGRVIAAPQQPPRFLSSPGIKVAGRDLPAQYEFPLENTQINTNTGMLIRQSGYPLPMVDNLVRYSDGKWYQAPTNSWSYTGSPLQPYNQDGPFKGMNPSSWAMLANDNFVNLSTGEVFNNLATPVPEIEVAFKDNKAYAVPRDPFQFMESPYQPYNYPNSNLVRPAHVPAMAVGGDIGFKQGYNPDTIQILTDIQGLPLNYNYNLNTPEVVPEIATQPIVVGTLAPTTAP